MLIRNTAQQYTKKEEEEEEEDEEVRNWVLNGFIKKGKVTST